MNTNNWKQFKMSELFASFERGKVHSQNSLPLGDEYFYVGAKKEGCGVMSKCGYDKELISKGNCLVFICNGEGSVGYCNYIDRDFMASGDLMLAYGDFLNEDIALFLETLLDRERPKYSFGRKYGKYVKTTSIPLPVDSENKPDWQWIERYVKTTIIPKLPQKAKAVWLKRSDTKPVFANKLVLNTIVWQWFRVEKIFKLEKCKCSNATELLEEGDEIAYIGAKKNDNGIMNYVKRDNDLVTKGNCIVFIGDGQGSVGYCLYQSNDFIGSTTLIAGYNISLNKYNALFLIGVLDQERYRYSFGRKYKKTVIDNSFIKLPAILNANGEYVPDWQWMEDYIKGLPYSGCL